MRSLSFCAVGPSHVPNSSVTTKILPLVPGPVLSVLQREFHLIPFISPGAGLALFTRKLRQRQAHSSVVLRQSPGSKWGLSTAEPMLATAAVCLSVRWVVTSSAPAWHLWNGPQTPMTHIKCWRHHVTHVWPSTAKCDQVESSGIRSGSESAVTHALGETVVWAFYYQAFRK